jgi:16S rRNA (adenine1518-N6/adenine1519-N6)-dimethyltransferase
MLKRKPRLGQCFLQDSSIAEMMVEAAEVNEEDRILEIGPGHGIITYEIFKKTKNLVVIEKDIILAKKIEKLFPEIEVIRGDILKIDFSVDKIVSNIPFEISSPLLKKLSEKEWKVAILILQKEFVERFFAQAGKKKYSRLTLFMNYYFEIEKIKSISKGKFLPRPKVDAVVVRLKKRQVPFQTNENFWNLVNALFRHKRKIVRGALKVEGYSSEKLDKLKELGSIRVNNLTLNNVKEIFDALS